MRIDRLTPQFVEFIPEKLEQGVLYVSLKYEVAIHLCACGCGIQTVTPLGTSGWTFFYDGKASLHPSIGNQQFPCGSHYWIEADTVRWA
jgi:hypothetical protein